MARRKRRRDKQVHAKNLDDVIIALIESPRWRETLLQLEAPGQRVIDARAVAGQDDPAARRIRRYQLSYLLSVDPNNESGDPDPADDAKVFKLEAAKHPSVYVYAEELLGDIGFEAS